MTKSGASDRTINRDRQSFLKAGGGGGGYVAQSYSLMNHFKMI